MREVLVTGAEGPVADAVQRRLRMRVDCVRSAIRGDHLAGRLKNVEGVVVLDGASPRRRSDTYVLALRTVLSLLPESGNLPRIVTCTYPPADPKRREAYYRRAQAAEGDIRAAGVELTSLRSALVVGTPHEDGPSDLGLFHGWRPVVPIPGNGSQTLTPLRIDDLAELIVAALLEGSQPGSHELGGRETLTADALIRQLNPGRVPIVHRCGLLLRKSRVPAEDGGVEGAAETAHQFNVELQDVTEAWPGSAAAAKNRRLRNRTAVGAYARPPSAWIGALFFALVGVTALAAGVHDLFAVAEVRFRLSALLLIFTGLFTCFGAVALMLVRWPARFAVGILASVVTFLLGLALLAARLAIGDPHPWDPVWPAIMVTSLLLAVALRRRGGPVLRTLVTKRGFPQLLTSLVTVGAVVSAFQLWYVNFYLPSTAEPSLSLTASWEDLGERGRHTVLRLTLTATNTADIPINILGSAYQVRGTQIRPPRRPRISQLAGALAWERPVRTGSHVHEGRVLQAGAPLATGEFLDQAEQVTDVVNVYVPTRAYDGATVDFSVVTSRRKLVLSTPDIPVFEDNAKVISARVPLEPQGWLRDAVQGDLYVQVRRLMFRRPQRSELRRCFFFPVLDVYIDREDRAPESSWPGCDPYAAERMEYYGVQGTSASADVSLQAAERN